jgi:H+/Cl- antiporter ClcA
MAGASVGPEAALGNLGGGFGTWLSLRRGCEPEEQKINTMTGMAAAFGALLPTPVFSVMILAEIAGGNYEIRMECMVLSTLAAVVGFIVFEKMAGGRQLYQIENGPVNLVRSILFVGKIYPHTHTNTCENPQTNKQHCENQLNEPNNPASGTYSRPLLTPSHFGALVIWCSQQFGSDDFGKLKTEHCVHGMILGVISAVVSCMIMVCIGVFNRLQKRVRDR